MFAKTLLSLVSTLFIGSQLIAKANAAITECDVAGISSYDESNFKALPACGNGAITLYCKISGSNTFTIYGYDAASAGCSTALDGAFAFNESTGTVISLNEVNISDMSNDITANVALYNCDGTQCKKTSGIIRDNTKNYIVAEGGGADPSSVSSFEVTSCATGKINTNEDNVLCLDATTIKANTVNKRYIMENVAGNAFGTGGENNSKFIVIKHVANIYAYDNLVANDDYCVSDGTLELTSRVDNYCTGSVNCDKYFKCTTQLCENKSNDYDTRDPLTCEPISGDGCDSEDEGDYYFIAENDNKDESDLSGDLLSAAGTTGFLYKCTINASGDNTGCAVDKKSAGYFVNAGTTGNIKYIECKPNGTNTSCQGLTDVASLGENKGTAASCTKGTDEYIVDGDNYKLCTGPADASSTAINYVIRPSCTYNGELIKDGSDYKICVKKSDTTLVAVAYSTLAASASKSYFIDSVNTNAFNDITLADHFVAITIDAKKAVVDRSATPKKYRYAKKITFGAVEDGGVYSREIIEKTGASGANMCQNDSLDTSVGHEFAMTIPYTGSDNVNHYKDNTA